MSADGTVNIDVKLDAQQPTQTAKDLDDLLKDIGKGTGKEAKKSINENSVSYTHLTLPTN